MTQIKKLEPKIAVELRGFQIGETKEGLKENLDGLIGELPIIVAELPQVEGTTGFGLRIHHSKEGWSLDVQSSDWLIADNYGTIMAIPADQIEEHFNVSELKEVSAE